jgi:hypothetical protein
MNKYIIAFVLSPLLLVFSLSQLANPKQWILDIAGDHWIAYTVGAYYLLMFAIFWLAYLTKKKVL